MRWYFLELWDVIKSIVEMLLMVELRKEIFDLLYKAVEVFIPVFLLVMAVALLPIMPFVRLLVAHMGEKENV